MTANIPEVKLKSFTVFPSNVQATSPILLDKTAGVYTLSLDEDQLRTDIGAPSIQDVIDATTAAQGYAASAAASAAALGNQVAQYDTLAQAIAATIDPGINGVRIHGRGAVSDRGGSFWTRLGGTPSPARSWHFQNTHDGVWWVMTVGWFLSPAMFGTTAAITAIQDALDYLNEFGLVGGRVTLEPNQIYTGTAAPKIYKGITLDYNGSKTEASLSGGGRSAYGTQVADGGWCINGWSHSIDAGITGSSFIYGAGISLGVTNGEAGNLVGSPDYFAGGKPHIRNMKVSTTRVGGQAISIVGDIDIDIVGLEFPDSTTAGGGISADWGDYGGTTVAPGSGPGGSYVSDLERLTAFRAAFDAGTYVTTHPRGRIVGVRGGVLSNTSTQNGLLRFSACREIIVSDVSVEEIGGPIVNYVGGDFGAEFAPANVKPLVCKGIRASNLRSTKCDNQGVFVDTYGDNLGNAIALGYPALTSPLMRGDIILSQLNITGAGSSNDGIRVQTAKGVEIHDSNVTGFSQGINIEDSTESVLVRGGFISANRGNGATIKAVSTIKKIRFEGVDIQGNGTSGVSTAGIRVSGGSDVVIDQCYFGGDTETTQQYAVYADSTLSAKALTVTRNVIRNVKAGGTVFQFGAGGDDILWLVKDNEYSGSEVYISGQEVIPVERTPRGVSFTGSSAFHTRYICRAVAMSGGITPPAGPTYVQGDLCEVPDAASAACAIARRGATVWASLVNAP